MLAGFLFTKADKIFGLDESAFDPDDEGVMKFLMVISGLLGFVTVVLVSGFFLIMIYGTYADNKMYAEHEKQSKINAEKRAIAAKKRKNNILENHQSDIQKLDEMKNKFEENPEDYDLNKPVYQSRGIEKWANGYTSKANLIKVLNELINCEQRYWTSELEEEINGHSGSYPEDWMKYFDAFDVKSGVRNRKGKEISWWGHYYTQSEESDIILIT